MKTEPYVNKIVFAQLKILHMQYSGQYSIDTEASVSLHFQVSIEEVYKSYTNSDIVKMQGETTLSKNFTERTLTCIL